ncbi:MAG: hypothetical protein DRO05_04685 [Thermoproteota archaeon]|nr:MAG: hypothetical protein DRO05_04685 [Candidatus Korarchaeota archaeon]
MSLGNKKGEESFQKIGMKPTLLKFIWFISFLNPLNWIAIALWWVISKVITSGPVVEAICRWIATKGGIKSRISALIKGKKERAEGVIIEISHLRREGLTKLELIKESLKISKKLSLLPTAYVTYWVSDFYTEYSKGVPLEEIPFPSWIVIVSLFAPSVVMVLYLPYLYGRDSGVMMFDREEGEIYTLGSVFKGILDNASLLSLLLLYLNFLRTVRQYLAPIDFFALAIAFWIFPILTYIWSILSGVAPSYFYLKRLSRMSSNITKKFKSFGAPLVKLSDLMERL